ncbi:PDZ and LIM domain protein 5 isoform X1 [Accipiter gentilis]|uniref:PDZ and LIM domain protein 5 isoform X1 n=1 Tax=Astur gentilis TaxID=8957 RepID=UPI002110B9F0|nr:PDZ and LIM domain protein 5 isoform X1 [Accipiter gentilis]XP_049671389.1 PDZ and LIM domain protein 5 isoform X1 [Accipiter gentilis]XP_049671390.1 PDZ and LIM domain protein 5 isoform X1 [Accipiter gentilis]
MSNYSVSLVGPAPWGFRLQGGKDFNVPLSISRLNDGGKAARAHVGIGDVVLTIDGISTDGMTHLEAQNKIKACTGNLNMTLQRVASVQKPDLINVPKGEPTEVVKPVPIASAVAPKVTATASVAYNKTPRPFGAVTSSKVTSIPSPSSAFAPAQVAAPSPTAAAPAPFAVPGLHVNAKPNAEQRPPAPSAAKPAVNVPRQPAATHNAAPSASAGDGAQDVAEGPRRGFRENQGESKQQNGPPRKHIVDTYTEFYHTPTHSDASKKRLIEDTEDWHPRTGTTQSRSFRILAQITGTDHMKEPEREAAKKTKKSQTENGDFSIPADLPNGAGTQDTCINLNKSSVATQTLEMPPVPEFPSAPLPPMRKITAELPAPDAASLFTADKAKCAVATQTPELPLPTVTAVWPPSATPPVETALGLPPAPARHDASLPTHETNSFNKISSWQSKSSVSHTSFCARKVLLENPLGRLPEFGPAPLPVLSPFKQRSKIKSMAAAAVSAAVAVRARLSEPSVYRSLLDALLITPVTKPPLQAIGPSRKSTSALELQKSKSDSLEATQPAAFTATSARSVPTRQEDADARPAPTSTTSAAALKPTGPPGAAKYSGWQPASQAAPASGWTSNSIKTPGTTAPSEKFATAPQLNEQDTLVQRAEHIPAGKRTPMCAHCNQVIRGPFLVALGKSWHPEEFNCAHCKTSMAYIGFVEEKGALYCEVCYEKFFAPECSKCQRKILGEVINALKQTWHVSCFVCVACHNPIRNNVFHLEDGDPYCETDYYALFGTMCHGCEFPIEAGDRFLEALGHTWHDTCFVCSVCSDSLEGQTFFSKKDKPLCKKHAHSINI